MSQCENGRRSRGVVVRPVIDQVLSRSGRVCFGYAKVIKMGGQEDCFSSGFGATKDADCIPGLGSWCVLEGRQTLLKFGRKWRRKWATLDEGLSIAARFKAERLQLRGRKEDGKVLVTCS